MSYEYAAIPFERREQYLANANAAFNEATESILEPAILDIASLLIKEAEGFQHTHNRNTETLNEGLDEFTQLDAYAPQLGDDVERFVQESDLYGDFVNNVNNLLPSIEELNRIEATPGMNRRHTPGFGTVAQWIGAKNEGYKYRQRFQEPDNRSLKYMLQKRLGFGPTMGYPGYRNPDQPGNGLPGF